MKRYKTPDDIRKMSIGESVKCVLGTEYTYFSVDKILHEEDLIKETSEIEFSLKISGSTDVGKDVIGAGVGLVDAFFNSLLTELTKEYCSLQTISLEDFSVSMSPNSSAKHSCTDATAVVDLIVKNSTSSVVHFHSESRSITAACIDVSLQTVEYYVNCEKAVLKLSKLIDDALKRQRMDLHESYVHKLSDIVNSNSYVEAIKRMKNKN